jgi:hypothetical protein
MIETDLGFVRTRPFAPESYRPIHCMMMPIARCPSAPQKRRPFGRLAVSLMLCIFHCSVEAALL